MQAGYYPKSACNNGMLGVNGAKLHVHIMHVTGSGCLRCTVALTLTSHDNVSSQPKAYKLVRMALQNKDHTFVVLA